MGANPRTKGAAGERELADIIFYATGKILERNLEQTRGGGHDLNGIEGLSIEVKRQERLCVPAWWRQTLKQAEAIQGIPILAYRQNRRPWQFIVGKDKAHKDKAQFMVWLKQYISML